jgi:hypothetical protein
VRQVGHLLESFTNLANLSSIVNRSETGQIMTVHWPCFVAVAIILTPTQATATITFPLTLYKTPQFRFTVYSSHMFNSHDSVLTEKNYVNRGNFEISN